MSIREDIGAKKKVIELYGDLSIFDCRLDEEGQSPRVLLQSHTTITKIYGHGIDLSAALENLYKSLYATMTTVVRRVEHDG